MNTIQKYLLLFLAMQSSLNGMEPEPKESHDKIFHRVSLSRPDSPKEIVTSGNESNFSDSETDESEISPLLRDPDETRKLNRLTCGLICVSATCITATVAGILLFLFHNKL